MYHQLYNALGENVSTVYGAMMDEMDEVRVADIVVLERQTEDAA